GASVDLLVRGLVCLGNGIGRDQIYAEVQLSDGHRLAADQGRVLLRTELVRVVGRTARVRLADGGELTGVRERLGDRGPVHPGAGSGADHRTPAARRAHRSLLWDSGLVQALRPACSS